MTKSRSSSIPYPELYRLIEKTAPLAGAAAWDKSGLQVTCTRKEATALAVCLDPCEPSVRQAVEQGADCILSHHPLSLSPSLPNRDDNWFRVLRLLLGQDIALYAAHTSLDTNPDGPVGWLAGELGLKDPCLLETVACNSGTGGKPAGFGLVGDLPQAMDLQGICRLLARHVSLECATVTWPQAVADAERQGQAGRLFQRVAYCTGSGSSLLPLAASAGAELFITGDVKYHAALESPVCLLDVGHHSLEEEMMRRFAASLQKELGIRVFFVPSRSPFKPVILQ